MSPQREDPLLEINFIAADYNNGKLYGNDYSTDAKAKAILEENYKYSKEYNELRKQEGNQLDAVHQYRRSWLQTINLAIASVVLGVLIYKQK
tara:strand:+ start:230 stop:505 length:276 start_codon:yes stop_codon:yes gene_type:complete